MSDLDKKKPYLSEEEEEGGGDEGGFPLKSSFDPQNWKEEGESGEEGGTAGTGGRSGEIEFHYHDPYSIAPRDDQLPSEEIKRLLIVHDDLHKAHVDKQRLARKERAALKEGKVLYTPEGQRKGLGGGGGSLSRFKQHPISLKAQFSGIDKQVSNLPTNQEAQTNNELRDALENRYQLRHAPQNAPRFNPKPRPGY